MNEQVKFEVIKRLVDHNCKNKERAAIKLGCTIRHINRLVAGYKKHGKAYFIHGNTGKTPVNKTPENIKQKVINLYKTKYYDANFQHFKELLEENENIVLSVSNITTILEKAEIYSPRTTRAKKKRIKIELRKKLALANTEKQKIELKSNVVRLEDAHPRRPRCAYFGEMIQMDASEAIWFNNTKTYLHLAIDDALGRVVGGYFDTEETLNGYYNILYQILSKYGIPYSFYTDNRTVFVYKLQNDKSIENNSHTQFAYACKQLGIELKTTSVPQSKGRIERLNGSFQSRLPIELRIANVKTIDVANNFLKKYINKYNKQFALPLKSVKSAFEEAPSKSKINLILSVLSERKVDSGHCIKYLNKYYKLIDGGGKQVFFLKDTVVIVIKSFNNKLYGSVNNKVFILEEIKNHETISKNFDLSYKVPKPKKKYIPPMSHPWKKYEFRKFINIQLKKGNTEFELLA